MFVHLTTYAPYIYMSRYVSLSPAIEMQQVCRYHICTCTYAGRITHLFISLILTYPLRDIHTRCHFYISDSGCIPSPTTVSALASKGAF